MNRFKIYLILLLLATSQTAVTAQTGQVKVHLRGVQETKVTVQSLTGISVKAVAELAGLKGGQTGLLRIPKEALPGEFVLRFDYKENQGSTPYPAERRIVIGNQDLELWVHPKHINNPDSTYFQKGERENAMLATFSAENQQKREKLGLLQNLLMGYDKPQSAFYKSAVNEFESRRREYNDWLKQQSRLHAGLFVSHTFLLQNLPAIEWKGSESDRLQSLIANYFEGIDFRDSLLTKTSGLRDWMNGYVNIYGTMATTEALRDSLFTLAGRRAIEKAREGHPMVYGWMVDYFYNGYESFNMQAGIRMLEPYLGDPRCMTTKRIAIEKRLKGIETLKPGVPAPDFMIKDDSGKQVEFSKYKSDAKYKLLLFWSADCQHCKELIKVLHPWYEQDGKSKVEVFAISLDDTDTEIASWEKATGKLPGFKHRRAASGINSPEANAYYVLSTPTMVLIEARTNKIVAMPDNLESIKQSIR